MNKSLSLHLDGIRALAAFTVFFSHLAYQRFTGGAYLWIRDLNLGSDAVVVFFVLSGFLIAHAAQGRTASEFVRARVARITSVALPAIALTLVLDAVGRMGNPVYYAPPWAADGPVLLEVVRAITFTNEWWFFGSRLGTNGPYWSLAYEVWYYALFAASFYAHGRRRMLLLVVGVFFVGPRIMLLAPCWIAGVALYNLGIRDERLRFGPRTARVMALAPFFIYGGLLAVGAPHFFYGLTIAASGLREPSVAFGFSNEFVWNYLVAALVVMHLAGVIALSRRRADPPAWMRHAVRWPADRSFSLYLYHYPILSALAALTPLVTHSPIDHALLAGAVLTLVFVLAEATERRLAAWRRAVDAVFTHCAGAVHVPRRDVPAA